MQVGQDAAAAETETCPVARSNSLCTNHTMRPPAPPGPPAAPPAVPSTTVTAARTQPGAAPSSDARANLGMNLPSFRRLADDDVQSFAAVSPAASDTRAPHWTAAVAPGAAAAAVAAAAAAPDVVQALGSYRSEMSVDLGAPRPQLAIHVPHNTAGQLVISLPGPLPQGSAISAASRRLPPLPHAMSGSGLRGRLSSTRTSITDVSATELPPSVPLPPATPPQGSGVLLTYVSSAGSSPDLPASAHRSPPPAAFSAKDSVDSAGSTPPRAPPQPGPRLQDNALNEADAAAGEAAAAAAAATQMGARPRALPRSDSMDSVSSAQRREAREHVPLRASLPPRPPRPPAAAQEEEKQEWQGRAPTGSPGRPPAHPRPPRPPAPLRALASADSLLGTGSRSDISVAPLPLGHLASPAYSSPRVLTSRAVSSGEAATRRSKQLRGASMAYFMQRSARAVKTQALEKQEPWFALSLRFQRPTAERQFAAHFNRFVQSKVKLVLTISVVVELLLAMALGATCFTRDADARLTQVVVRLLAVAATAGVHALSSWRGFEARTQQVVAGYFVLRGLLLCALHALAATSTRAVSPWFYSSIFACGLAEVTAAELVYLLCMTTFFSGARFHVAAMTSCAILCSLLVCQAVLAALGRQAWQDVSHTALLGVLTVVAATTASRNNSERVQREFLLRRAIVADQKKADDLLHRMLPLQLAKQLEAGLAVEDLKAELFDEVTVMFCYIHNFEQLVVSTPATELVELMHRMWEAVDALAERFNGRVDKIESSGDTYIAASGCPVPCEQHAKSMAQFALALLELAASSPHFRRTDGQRVSLKIGLHTGPVVAGLVGTKTHMYKLFGDTMNTCSRMASYSLPSRAQLSSRTHALLTHIRTECAGERDIKGKGRMTTYYLVGVEAGDDARTLASALSELSEGEEEEEPALLPSAAEMQHVEQLVFAAANVRRATTSGAPGSARAAGEILSAKSLQHPTPRSARGPPPVRPSPLRGPSTRVLPQTTPPSPPQSQPTQPPLSASSGGATLPPLLPVRAPVQRTPSLLRATLHVNVPRGPSTGAAPSTTAPATPWSAEGSGVHLPSPPLTGSTATSRGGGGDMIAALFVRKREGGGDGAADAAGTTPREEEAGGEAGEAQSEAPVVADRWTLRFTDSEFEKDFLNTVAATGAARVSIVTLLLTATLAAEELLERLWTPETDAHCTAARVGFSVVSLVGGSIYAFGVHRHLQQLPSAFQRVSLAWSLLHFAGYLAAALYVDTNCRPAPLEGQLALPTGRPAHMVLFLCYFAFLTQMQLVYTVLACVTLVCVMAVTWTTQLLLFSARHGVAPRDPLHIAFAAYLLVAAAIFMHAKYLSEMGLRYTFFVRGSLYRQKLRYREIMENSFPNPVAVRLLRGHEVPLEDLPNITICFADVKNFTPLSAALSPSRLCTILNVMYSEFDVAVDELQLFKLDTIGDCFVACAGVPGTNPRHASAVVSFCDKMLQALAMLKTRFPALRPVDLRVGVHTGPAVGGVVSHKKPRYMVWGATVLVANRMESTGVPGCTKISGSTLEELSAEGVHGNTEFPMGPFRFQRMEPDVTLTGSRVPYPGYLCQPRQRA